MPPQITRSLLLLILLLPPALWLAATPVSASPPLLCRALPTSQASARAHDASLAFWEAFHGNRYDHVDDVISQLTIACQEHPDDPTLNMLLGMSHYWKFQERGRAALKVAEVLPHLELAVGFLQKAQQLNLRSR